MKIRFKQAFKHFWLLVSVILLALPVFLPSYPNTTNLFDNVIGLVSIVMFIISFPCSLLGLPLFALLKNLSGIDAHSIQGLYLQLIAFFVMGYLQWFIIVPRIFKRSSEARANRVLESYEAGAVKTLEAKPQTPLEQVLFDEESKYETQKQGHERGIK